MKIANKKKVSTRSASIKQQESQIRQLRRKKDFLPYFSDAFFERIKKTEKTVFLILLLGIAYVAFLFLLAEKTQTVQFLLVFEAVVVAVHFSKRYIENILKKFGYTFNSEQIVLNIWGMKRYIPYADIKAAVLKKKVCINEKGLQVPYGRGKICFPYEIGNAKQQTHVQECYDNLRKGLECPMPLMENKNIDCFDRLYFYNQSFRRCIVGLLIIEFFLMIINQKEIMEDSFYLLDAILAMVQYGLLIRIFKSTLHGQKNALKMKQLLGDKGGFRLKLRAHRQWESLVIMVGIIILNFLIFRVNWL